MMEVEVSDEEAHTTDQDQEEPSEEAPDTELTELPTNGNEGEGKLIENDTNITVIEETGAGQEKKEKNGHLEVEEPMDTSEVKSEAPVAEEIKKEANPEVKEQVKVESAEEEVKQVKEEVTVEDESKPLLMEEDAKKTKSKVGNVEIEDKSSNEPRVLDSIDLEIKKLMEEVGIVEINGDNATEMGDAENKSGQVSFLASY